METNYSQMYPDSVDKNSFQSGLEFQDYVCVLLAKKGIILQNLNSKLYQCQVGENLQGFEIKLDRLFKKYDHLSIEIAEKSRADLPQWTPSGIYRNDNSWLYIQGNYETLYVFSKRWLINLHKTGRYQNQELNGTVRKFYLPLRDADKYCAMKLDCVTEKIEGAEVTNG